MRKSESAWPQVCTLPANPWGLLSLQEFIRLGSLSKLSGKGLQQRMFFLVSELCVLTTIGDPQGHRNGPRQPEGDLEGRGSSRQRYSHWSC